MDVETLYLWRVVVVARKRQRLASMNTETGRWRYSPCEEVARKHWLQCTEIEILKKQLMSSCDYSTLYST